MVGWCNSTKVQVYSEKYAFIAASISLVATLLGRVQFTQKLLIEQLCRFRHLLQLSGCWRPEQKKQQRPTWGSISVRAAVGERRSQHPVQYIERVLKRTMGAPVKAVDGSEKPKTDEASSSSQQIVSSKDAFNADVILGQLGGYGWFQLRYIFCTGYGMLFPTALILIYTFVGAPPRYR